MDGSGLTRISLIPNYGDIDLSTEFLSRLKQPGTVVADGAMGTMLLERGLKPGDCPERMNLEQAGVLEEIAGLYLAAGAEVVQTNTFGGSPLKLARYGLEARADEINRRGGAAARNAAGGRAWVAASVGPCGKLLLPYGDTPEEAVYESFRIQISALIAEGADMVAIETMTDLAEAVLAVRAARSASTSVPISASMTFDSTPRGYYTIMGATIGQAAKGLAEAGADMVGSNCGNGSAAMTAIAREFMKQATVPVIIRSNAGLPELRGGRPAYPETPEHMAGAVKELAGLGVKLIGGCCGTTPSHIAAFRRALAEG